MSFALRLMRMAGSTLIAVLAAVMVANIPALLDYTPEGARLTVLEYITSVGRSFGFVADVAAGQLHSSSRSALTVFLKGAPLTLIALVGAVAISLLASLVLGYLGSRFSRSFIPKGFHSVVVAISASTPEFLAIAVYWTLSIKAYRIWGFAFSHLYYPLEVVSDPVVGDYLIVALITAIAPTAYLTQTAAQGFNSAYRSDYLRTAVAKGVGPLGVLRRHTLKNVLVDMLDLIPSSFGLFMTGLIFAEYLFQYPGLANSFVRELKLFALDRGGGPRAVSLIAVFFTLLFLILGTLASSVQRRLDRRIGQ